MCTRGLRTRLSLSWMLSDGMWADLRSGMRGLRSQAHTDAAPRAGGAAGLLLARRLRRLGADQPEQALARGLVGHQLRHQLGERHAAPADRLLQGVGDRAVGLGLAEELRHL